MSLIGDLTTTAAAATKRAWSMAHGRRDCKHKPQKDSHTDTALHAPPPQAMLQSNSRDDEDDERSKKPPGQRPYKPAFIWGRARRGGPLLSPYTSWFLNSFCGEFPPFCENYFEERIFCRNFPRFLGKKIAKKRKKSSFSFAKIHQNCLQHARVLKVFFYFHIAKFG